MYERPLKQKTIGILGGASDIATIEYYKYLNQITNQKLGRSEIAETLIAGMNFGNIKTFIQNNQMDKLINYISKSIDSLILGGADVILCASNTLHEPLDEILSSRKKPYIHIVDPTAEKIKQNNLKRVILFGTKSVMKSMYIRNIYENKYGLKIILPSNEDQDEIDRIIFEELVKSEFRIKSKERFLEIAKKLSIKEKAEGLILGCTEIFLLFNQDDYPNLPMFNTAKLHCEAAINFIHK